jgi:hypothetical protein
MLDAHHAELKSTRPKPRGRGVGQAMVDHPPSRLHASHAEPRDLDDGSLRTAIAYRAGFTAPTGGDYPDSPYSMCMTLSLNAERPPT